MEEGPFHLFVGRWREDHSRGHMAWQQSEVARAVSKNRPGPYRVAKDHVLEEPVMGVNYRDMTGPPFSCR
jgi:hypothetical protein